VGFYNAGRRGFYREECWVFLEREAGFLQRGRGVVSTEMEAEFLQKRRGMVSTESEGRAFY